MRAAFVSLLAPERARPTAGARAATEVEGSGGGIAWTALGFTAAIAVAVYAVIQLWFINVQPGFDDQGLFNPIYLFSHAGNVTYPIYPFPGSTEAYFVHPPGDAVVVGAFQWLTGWPGMASGIGSLLVFVFIALGVTAWSRFSLPAKVGFCVGMAAGVVAWGGIWFLRPDDRLAISFLAGLLALETGRLAGWSLWRLFLGAVLVCISATLHYPGSANVFTVAIYAVWVIRERGSLRLAARPLAALGVGAALVVIPYAALFVIPFWHYIQTFANAANQALAPGYNGVIGAFRLHRDVYHYIYDTHIGGPFLTALASPFTRLGIPLLFVTTPILLWRRETRGIALGSLPSMLFLLLFTHTKIDRNADYYTTEFTLYYSCLAYLTLLAVGWTTQRLLAARWGTERVRLANVLRIGVVGAAGAGVLALVFFRADPVSLTGSGRDWHPDHADMEIARAATAATLPSNSVLLIDPAVNTWFTAGGWTAYAGWREAGSATDLSQLNLRAYFASVTGVAAPAETWESWTAYNVQRQTVGNWYSDGLLKPFRFYFGRTQADGSPPDMRYLLLSPKSQPVVGNVLQGSTLTRYVQATGGSHVLVEALCDVSTPAVKALPVANQVPIFLPGRTNVDPYVDEQQGHPRFAMQTFLDTRTDYLSNQLPALRREGCQIRGVVPLQVAWKRPASKILDAYKKVDARRVIKFPDYISAVNALYSPTVPVQRVSRGVTSDFALGLGASEHFEASGQLVRTPRKLYSEAGVFPLRLVPGRRNWVLIDGKITQGQIQICLYSNGTCATQRTIPSGQHGPFYLPVPSPLPSNPELFIGNQDPGSASEIDITDVGVEAARVPTRGRAARGRTS